MKKSEIREARLPSGRFYCCAGLHPIKDDEWFYTINPLGGYDRSEFLCCETCIKKPEFSDLKQRMIDAGAKELLDA